MISTTEPDIGPLTWVKGEIDLALARADEALSNFAAAPQDGAQIHAARNHLRQARGALTIVGLNGVTQFAEAIEAMLAGIEENAVGAEAAVLESGRRGLAAIRQYLDDLIDGAPDQPLRMFSAYRNLALARGLPEPEPTELFFPDLTLRPPRREVEPQPLTADALAARIKAARLGFQRGLVKWLKNDPKGAAEMRTSVAMIEMAQSQPAARAFWWVAMAFFDALIAGGIESDKAAKQLCSRIESQVRKLHDGSGTVADRLMRDVLYHVARAAHGGDHLECVRAAYQLDNQIPAGGEAEDASHLKPVLRAGRDLLAATKDHWNRFCAGTNAALAQFRDGANQLMGRLGELGNPAISRLAAGVAEVADVLHADASRHNDTVALELATALLLLEGALENFPEMGHEFPHQVDTVAERLAAILRGEELSALEIPQLDEMSRKAQERLLMHQVAKEILVNLAVIEQTLDAFFRSPMQRDDLAQLAKPLAQMTGALIVLGQDRAVEILRECEGKIAGFRDENYTPRHADFEEVASKLSGIGFFVEKLKFGPADIDAIINPVPVTSTRDAAPSVEQEIGKALSQTQILAAQLKAAPTAAQEDLRQELKQNLEALREDAHLVADQGLADQANAALDALGEEKAGAALGVSMDKIAAPAPLAAPAAPSEQTARLAEASETEIDAELLSIFLEEAHEVLDAIAENLPRLAAQPHDRETLTTVRRSFHTLKGSGRMVGLNDLGEAAWAVEQALNKWLHQEIDLGPEALAMLDQAQPVFRDWVAQLEAGGSPWHDASQLIALCERLRSDEAEAPQAPVESAPAPLAEPVMEPAAADEEALLPPEEEWALPTAEVAADEPVLPEEAAPAFAEASEPAEVGESIAPMLEELLPPPQEEVLPAHAADELLAPMEEFAEMPAVGPASEEGASLDMLAPAAEIPQAPESQVAAVAEFSAAEAFALPFELPAEGAAQPDEYHAPDTVSVGDHQISQTLYELYVEEAHSHVVALQAGLESGEPINRDLMRLAHTVAGISATAGVPVVREVAHALELVLERFLDAGTEPDENERMVFARAVGALEGMVGAIAQLRMPGPQPDLVAELDAIASTHYATEVEVAPAVPVAEIPVAEEETTVAADTVAEELSAFEPVAEVAPPPPVLETQPAPAPEIIAPHPEQSAALSEEEEERRRSRLRDDLDAQLLPFFLEEATDLMRDIGNEVRNWRERPDDAAISFQLRRLLHTLKGSARMAGAMSIGEIVHGLETRIEATTDITPAFLDEVDVSYDRSSMLIENLRRFGTVDPPEEITPAAAIQEEGQAPVVSAVRHEFAAAPVEEAVARPTLRVRADLIDKLVNEAGEMAIARARVEGEMRTVKTALHDLTENVIRLRNQLREIEIQAESQMQSQIAEIQTHEVNFDPLEFDRFTRFQELTRMMAESVNDVSTVQHNLLINLDHADAGLVAQARLNRELSQALMGVRMVPFSTVADRLYRVVRQTAKELEKRANLDIRGGQTELDRSVLEAMIGPIEHLLRNAVAHGLEKREVRAAAYKPEIGEIQLTLTQAGNEILIEMADDGAGLNLPRIRERAIERGLIGADETVDDARLMGMIFEAGFSTAEQVTEVAGRGVGMDVVKNETAGLGGRIEIESEPGRGARFRIYLPLTLAVTQAVLIQIAGHTYAVPSAMVEQVNEMKPEAIEKVRAAGAIEWLGNRYPWHYMAHLLGNTEAQPVPARRHWLLLLKGGSQRIALEVDGLSGNEEVVVKNIGAQLARVGGISGATVLGDGNIALIINPIALTTRHIPPIPLTSTAVQRISEETALAATPTVMVVDDSLTVRKITGRLLAREGYHVVTAKDGVDALEQLTEIIPDVMLVDIEMPRMDGFDLTRNVRADARTRGIPIIMITSRIADKHRNYAMEIGVNNYLGKPFDEDELLGLIAGYVKK
jgi:chemosensory pili system protein ChpA (sensor histidine kinase/response regulator)